MLATNPSSTFESVPRYFRMPRDVHREHLRVIALALLEAGERVSVLRLRECGVRGGTAALIALRQELVATGELPPEAAARVYARPLHQPGKKLSVDSSQLSEKTPSSPLTTDNRQLTTLRERSSNKQPTTAKQRRSRRLIERYNSAVRNVFGEDRARQIGAAP